MSVQTAQELVERADFVWYQRIQLAPGIYSPGHRDVDFILQYMGIPSNLTGRSVLDIGATNGGIAFALEARGATRVVAVDIYPPARFGFDQLRAAFGSHAEFVQGSIYDLPALLSEQFDIVMFLGVLYHLRHPILALDNVRALTRGSAYIETEVLDGDLPIVRDLSVAQFYRKNERAGDFTNWFAPTIRCLTEWCWSSGLEPEVRGTWPDPPELPSRVLLKARPTRGAPEFLGLSYEQRLHVQVIPSV